jgi:DNA polymerase-3 subunit alpha
VNQARKRLTKTGRSAGQQMAIVTLEDLDGQIEATIFAESLTEILKRYPNALEHESIVFVKGKVDKRREKPGLVVNEIIPLADAPGRLTTAVRLDLSGAARDPAITERLKPIMAKHKGGVDFSAKLHTNRGRTVIIGLGRIRPTSEMIAEMETLCGRGCIQLAGMGANRMKRLQQQKLFVEEAAPASPAPEMIPDPMEEELAVDLV